MTNEQIEQMKALEKQLAALKEIEAKEKARRKQEVVGLIAEKTRQMNALYAECDKLAREVDIQFYFNSGYEEFIVEENSTWDSSRC